MVLIACRAAGRTVERAEQTKDCDVLVDICARPTILARVVHHLRGFGFRSIEPFSGGEAGRCTFVDESGGGQIHVLCPDDADPSELDSVDGVQSLAIPGGRRALELSEKALVIFSEDTQDLVVRVPLLPGAIVVKAAAAVDARTSGQDRHIQDVANMLSVLEEPLRTRENLSETDRKLVSRLRTRLEDDGDVAWDRFSYESRLAARAAFDLLIG